MQSNTIIRSATKLVPLAIAGIIAAGCGSSSASHKQMHDYTTQLRQRVTMAANLEAIKIRAQYPSATVNVTRVVVRKLDPNHYKDIVQVQLVLGASSEGLTYFFNSHCSQPTGCHTSYGGYHVDTTSGF